MVANQMLFKTTDYGISWSRIGYELPPLTCVTGYLVDSAPNYYILYAGAGKDGVYKSIDLGYSWVPINNGLPLPLLDSAYKIVVNPANHAELFLVCRGRAIYYSSNGGDYWSYFPPPEGYLYSLRRQQFDVAKDGTLWLLCRKDVPVFIWAIVKRPPGSSTWYEVKTFDIRALPEDLVCSPFHSETVFYIDAVDSIAGRSYNPVLRTTDGGNSWEEVINSNIYGVSCLAFTPYSADTVYAGLFDDASAPRHAMLKSDHGGAPGTWYELPLNDQVMVYSVGCDPESVGVVFAGYKRYSHPDQGGVELGWNGGWNWSDVSSGLHYYPVWKHALVCQPTILFSSTGYGTAYSAQKLVYIPFTNKLCAVYQTRDSIYAAFSANFGQTWRYKKLLGPGNFPISAVASSGYPCLIWQRNIEPTPQVAGGELWFARYDRTNWSEPYMLASFTGPFNLDVNPPSFIIDPTTNIGYVVFEWRDRYINGPTSHLCLGWFDVNNPVSFQFTELEYALAPLRCEFPSITQSGNHLYIAFQREDKIFRIKWDIVNHQIVDRKQVSQDGRLAHHPFVDVHPNGLINYVYEDSTVNNIEIYRAYELNDVIYPVGNISNTPGKSQWPQICKGTTWITWSEYIWPPQDNNWEICYKDMEYEGYQILSQTLGMSKYSHGVVTRSPYWPPPYEPKLTAIWTEGNQSLYEIRAKTVTLPEISYFYVDAGKETPSPWTVQRDGYIQFAPEPEKTIDYHSQKLIYHFPNLNPAKRYRIKLVFYFESPGHNRWKMKIDADNIFHANLWLNLGEIATLERWLPTACYKDGEVYLNITKVIGDYALVAQIFIYEYEREIEEMAKNTQESNTSSFKEPRLSITPNPFYDHTVIHYFLPEDENQTKINIYDASGRLVQQFNHLIHTQSNQIKWDGTDCTGSALPNGIYFVVVTTSNYRLTKKIVLIR
ncbi:MAG: T9SS type A sorting domain-containing protein [candidate division WOR-3 bacterium]